MRISILANGFQENYIIDLINGLAETSENVKIKLVGPAIYAKNKINPRINYSNIGSDRFEKKLVRKALLKIVNYCKLIFQINRSNSDIIHIQWLNLNFIDGILIPLYYKIWGIRIFYTVHDVLPHSGDNLINRFLFYLIYRIPNHLIVHTEFIKTRLIKEFSIKPDKITVIRHGIYTMVDDAYISRKDACDKIGINSEDFVLLFFGHITKYKGLNILLSAINLLGNQIPSIRLIIAGKVNRKYKNEFNELLIRNDKSHLTVISDYIEDDKIQYYFKAADVTILPYLEASQSGVMFMSYTFGKPVIAPELGDFCKDIVPGKTGFLFKAGEPESLAASILQLYKEMNFRNPSVNDFIRDYSIENYSWKKAGQSLLKLYTSNL